MPSFEAIWDRLNQRGERALVTFVTAGDPDLQDLPRILDTLVASGADIIEVGLPFSDPIADGPVIQASSQRALDRGVKLAQIFETLRSWKNPGVPVVLMGYYNSILRVGLSEFAQMAADAGAHGTIVCDLTPEEADPWVEASRAHGLANIFLLAPTSTEARVKEACQRGSGFVYAVSRTGVTGSSQSASPDASKLVEMIRKHTKLPICIGFGISKPEHISAAIAVADGAVVGSSIVNLLHETWNNGTGTGALADYVKSLITATKP